MVGYGPEPVHEAEAIVLAIERICAAEREQERIAERLDRMRAPASRRG
jgi:hypothetical protein